MRNDKNYKFDYCDEGIQMIFTLMREIINGNHMPVPNITDICQCLTMSCQIHTPLGDAPLTTGLHHTGGGKGM